MTKRLPQAAKDAGKAIRQMQALRKALKELQAIDPYLHDDLVADCDVSVDQFYTMFDSVEADLKGIRNRYVK